MGRKLDNEQRSHQLHFLVTPQEKQQIVNKAQRSGTTLSHFIRQSCLSWGLDNSFERFLKLGEIACKLEYLGEKYQDSELLWSFNQLNQLLNQTHRNFPQ